MKSQQHHKVNSVNTKRFTNLFKKDNSDKLGVKSNIHIYHLFKLIEKKIIFKKKFMFY